jgi:two-component system OmpR family sensor kinase
MQSVHDVRSQIESRSGSNLAPLQLGDLPGELRPIVGSVNHLMDRLRRALESERNFATNSAHELRSPIAGALAQTQRLITQLPTGDCKHRAHKIETSLTGIAKLSEKLMQLARAESGVLVSKHTVNLFPVLELVLDEFNRSAGSANRLHFQCDGTVQFMTRLDPDGMGILMRNVIENALKHSPADSRVDVILKSDVNEIRVINAGSIVPSESIESLKTRFVRGSTAAAGSGLGLAIVEAVTQGSGVTVELYSPATGRTDGFEVRLKSLCDGTDLLAPP